MHSRPCSTRAFIHNHINYSSMTNFAISSLISSLRRIYLWAHNNTWTNGPSRTNTPAPLLAESLLLIRPHVTCAPDRTARIIFHLVFAAIEQTRVYHISHDLVLLAHQIFAA